MLLSLDAFVLAMLIANFAPRANTRDVAGKMYAFVRSIVSLRALNSQLVGIVVRRGLDDSTLELFLELPKRVKQLVVGMHDANGNLVGMLDASEAALRRLSPADKRAFENLVCGPLGCIPGRWRARGGDGDQRAPPAEGSPAAG